MEFEATDSPHDHLPAAPATGGLTIWRRWKPSDWRTAGLLAFLIALQLAGALLMPLGEPIEGWFWSYLSLAALGALFTPPALLAWWAVFGPQRLALRLPLTLWLAGAFGVCGAAGARLTSHDMDATGSFVIGAVWLLAFAITQLPLWLLRAARRWRLEQISPIDSSPVKPTSQFTLGGLLGWTFAAASLLAAWRGVLGRQALDFDLVTEPLSEVGGSTLFIVLAGLPSMALAWMLLASGRRRVLRAVLGVLILAGVAGRLAFSQWYFEDEMEQVIEVACIESGAILSGLLNVAVIWACGYRLNRRPKRLPMESRWRRRNVDFRSAKERPSAGRKTTQNVLVRPETPAGGRRLGVAFGSLLLIAAGLASSVPHRREVWRRTAVRADWRRRRFQVSFDESGKLTQFECDYGNKSISDETLRQIAQLPDVESLDLAHSAIADRQIALLAPLAGRLRELTLRETQVTDAGLRELGRFHRLESLNVANTHVTDAGVVHLRGLPKLRVLNLRITDVTDAAITTLARLPSLQELDVKLTAVSAAGAETFRQKRPQVRFQSGASHGELSAWLSHRFVCYSSLAAGGPNVGALPSPLIATRLHVRGREITDAAITLLTCLTNLEDLDLRDSAVTDAGVATLITLPTLRRLDLRGSAVTESGVARLASALPQCEIVR